MKTVTRVLIVFLIFTIFSCTKEQIDKGNALQSNDVSSAIEQDSLNWEDTMSLVSTAQGSKLEVVLGAIAQTHSSNPDVQAFGLRMVKDHSRQHKQIVDLAAKKGVPVPNTPSQDQQKEINELSQYYGDQFDKEYMSYEVWDHKHDIKDGTEEVRKGYDPDVKNAARVWLPVLVSHLENAERVAKSVDAPVYHEDD
jgi:putative membrane protein